MSKELITNQIESLTKEIYENKIELAKIADGLSDVIKEINELENSSYNIYNYNTTNQNYEEIDKLKLHICDLLLKKHNPSLNIPNTYVTRIYDDGTISCLRITPSMCETGYDAHPAIIDISKIDNQIKFPIADKHGRPGFAHAIVLDSDANLIRDELRKFYTLINTIKAPYVYIEDNTSNFDNSTIESDLRKLNFLNFTMGVSKQAIKVLTNKLILLETELQEKQLILINYG